MKFPRRAMAALAVMAAAVVTACGDSSVGASPLLVAGEYVLVVVNGDALPTDLRNDATGRLSVTAGRLVIIGETFSQELSLVEFAPDGTTTFRQSAAAGVVAYRSNNRIRFQMTNGGGEWEGTYYGDGQGGGQLEYTIEGNNGPIVFRFARSAGGD